ncbi:MAG TPA: HD domain-containing phosphohydrolase [Bdellovibrionota bacterium]|nr:HD domain-containing phosphohydrolase [Bdellovibrionota bacterium]
MPDDKEHQSLLQEVYEAGREEDGENQLQRIGKELVDRLFMLYRTGRVHDIQNEATNQAIQNLQKVLDELSTFGESVSITAVGEGFYLNKVLLKVEFSGFENFRFLSQLLRQFKIAGFTFTGAPATEELRSFLSALLKSGPDENSKEWIGHTSYTAIRIIPAGQMSEVEARNITAEMLSDPSYLLRLYLKTVIFLQEFIKLAEAGELTSLSRLQRTIHEFIDAMGEDRRTLLALTNIHTSESQLAYHSVNVMLFSLLMGRELGMSKRHLSDLGMAAMLHDIGKIQIPAEILEKRLQLGPNDWKELQKSNTYSLLQLIRLKGFNESALRRMLVAYEHTLSLQEGKGRRPILFSRIVAIGHCYDAMITPHSYRDALLPNEALKLMTKEEEKKFDGVLLHLFTKLMTLYPPGSLVLLNTKDMALVIDGPESRSDPAKPRVKFLYGPEGNRLPPKEIDLSSDRSGRSIVKSLDPSKYRINPLAHLFAEVQVA